MNILVVGANGFIGKRLCQTLMAAGFCVRAAVRSKEKFGQLLDKIEKVCVGDIGAETQWQEALKGVDIVIHLAARVHMMHDEAENPLAEYRRVNVEGTRRLAEQAIEAGVKRFIFLSTIKVNGEEAGSDAPFTERDSPQPQDDYALSKWEAEQVLQDFASPGAFETVIIRTPLVYGPGVKANFKSLIKTAGVGLPLPLKGINNRRSFLYLENLVDAIVLCVTHPKAAGETLVVSDGQDISTPDLLRMMAAAKNKKPRLFFVSASLLKMLARISGKESVLQKLTGSLVVDSSKIRNMLGWKPLFTLEEGIRKTIEEYKL